MCGGARSPSWVDFVHRSFGRAYIRGIGATWIVVVAMSLMMGIRSGRGLRRRLALAAAVVVALVPGAVSAVGTPDQQQLATSEGSAIYGPSLPVPNSVAQTFSPELTGELDQVDVFLEQLSGGSVGVTVEIRDVVSGAPASTPALATTSVPASAIAAAGSGGAFVAALFATPAQVTAGTQYAIVMYTGGSEKYIAWVHRADNNGGVDPYGGGEFLQTDSSPPTTSWLTVSGDV